MTKEELYTYLDEVIAYILYDIELYPMSVNEHKYIVESMVEAFNKIKNDKP